MFVYDLFVGYFKVPLLFYFSPLQLFYILKTVSQQCELLWQVIMDISKYYFDFMCYNEGLDAAD